MSRLEIEIEQRLELARQIAAKAAAGTLAYFCHSNLEVERKEDLTPVTIADREAEQFLRKHIKDVFPDDEIEGEEFGKQPGTSPFRWLLDPIDGTKSFVSGVPLFGTMVAVLHEEQPQIGVMEFPALGESIYAARGQGAWHQKSGMSPVESRVSAVGSLAEGLFCTTCIDTFIATERLQFFQRLQQRALLTRTWGDCYGYLLVATGRAEVMIDPELNPWDTAALLPILTEAGGTLTDFSGHETVFEGEAVATNGHILAEVLDLISA